MAQIEVKLDALLPSSAAASNLPQIPLIEVDNAQPALALLQAEPERIRAILAEARRVFPAAVMAFGERRSKAWLRRSTSPYCQEVAAVADALGETGGWFLNMNYEWACSGAVLPGSAAKDRAAVPRLLRALDWRIEGLGRTLVAARRHSPAGPWIDITWPGFVGCLQALAPGRFAAAINQAPLAKTFGVFGLDWLAARRRVARSRAIPPAHLLRQVFETAPDFATARSLLESTPIAAPAIFLLAGVEPDEGVIIERLAEKAALRPMPAIATNHWQGIEQAAWPRGIDSTGRAAQASQALGGSATSPIWCREPVINPLTRLILSAEPATGALSLMGVEQGRPATAVLTLPGALPANPKNTPEEESASSLTG